MAVYVHCPCIQNKDIFWITIQFFYRENYIWMLKYFWIEQKMFYNSCLKHQHKNMEEQFIQNCSILHLQGQNYCFDTIKSTAIFSGTVDAVLLLLLCCRQSCKAGQIFSFLVNSIIICTHKKRTVSGLELWSDNLFKNANIIILCWTKASLW